jgi:hypothetical protein
LVSAFATSYFPSVNYFRALVLAEKAVIDLGEHCKKQTERSRASILSANGLLKLTVPIIRPFGSKTSTQDIQISFVESWQRDHKRAISAAYSSAPYFDHYSEEIFALIDTKTDSLRTLNDSILKTFISFFDLPIDFSFSTKFIEECSKDFRDFDFTFNIEPYFQVDFGQKGFVANLSILDALFCLGPMTRKLIIP